MPSSPILLVEDDGLIRMDLADTLTDAGYDVIEASNADEALSILEGSQIGALLTDIDMPGSMNGIGLANTVSERCPTCKIVVISGRYSPTQGSLPAGAKFLSKPISEQALCLTMTEMDIRP